MKKIFSLLIAFSMTVFMFCVTVSAYNSADMSEKNNFVYTDKLLSDDCIALTALDSYEPNDFSHLYYLGGIETKVNPLYDLVITVNASLSAIDDDIEDAYEFAAYNSNESAEEIVVLLGNLLNGDEIELLIADGEKAIANGIVNGSIQPGAYVSFPVEKSHQYQIYIMPTKNSINLEIDYTLQIASRYIRDSVEYYTNPSTIYNDGFDTYSTPATITVKESEIPASAKVNSIFCYGNMRTSQGKIAGGSVKFQKDSTEVYGADQAFLLENLERFNLFLVGTWRISFRPSVALPTTFSNVKVRFDFTYDILG